MADDINDVVRDLKGDRITTADISQITPLSYAPPPLTGGTTGNAFLDSRSPPGSFDQLRRIAQADQAQPLTDEEIQHEYPGLPEFGGPALPPFGGKTMSNEKVDATTARRSELQKQDFGESYRQAFPRQGIPPVPQPLQTSDSIVRNAIGAFANPLMLIAATAGAFTKHSALNALAAATGVVEGLNERDWQKAYLQQHKFRNSVKETAIEADRQIAAVDAILNSGADTATKLGNIDALGDPTLSRFVRQGDLASIQQFNEGFKKATEGLHRATRGYGKAQERLAKNGGIDPSQPDPKYEAEAQAIANNEKGAKGAIARYPSADQARIGRRVNAITGGKSPEQYATERAEKAAKEAPPTTGVSPQVKQQLAAVGWNEQSIEDAARTFNRTGKMPPNLGRRQEGFLISGAINSKASELWHSEHPNETIENRATNWQLYRSAQVGIQRFTSGPQSNIVRSLGVVVDHLATLDKLATALDNGEIQVFNRIAQAWAEQYGLPAPTNFDTAKSIVGTEVIKALGVAGAGTAGEREGTANRFDRSNSPAQLHGAIKDVAQPLLSGQLEGLHRQFKIATGLPDEMFYDMLGPEAQKFLASPSGKQGGFTGRTANDRSGKTWRETVDGRWLDENGNEFKK